MGRKSAVTAANMNEGYATVHTVRIPLWPYLVAPLFCLVALPVTWGVHRVYATTASSAGWTGFSIALAAVGILIFTFFLSRSRGPMMNAIAMTNAVWGIAWCVASVLGSGPFHKAIFGFWLLGTFVVSYLCAVYRIMKQSRGPEDPRSGGVFNGEFAEFGDAVKSLKGAAFRRPVIDGASVTAAVELPPGRSFEEVQAAKREVASLLDVKATAVRMVADRDSERRGTMTVVPVDQLRDPIPDPGLEQGLSIADPLTLGLDEDGLPAGIILAGDPKAHRNAVGVMSVVGMSGSGKTELILRFLKEAMTRRDNDTFLIDCRKAGQLPGWVKRAAKRVVDGSDEALDFMDGLQRRIAERSAWLGARGFKQWERGCGLQFETYVIFEASSIIMDSNIVDLAESVRSVGMCIVLELQRCTWDRLPTSARSNITTHLCLGVDAEGDAAAALKEETIAAGAAPWKWGNKYPGYFYLEWSGRDESVWSKPCRAFIQDDQDREREVATVLGWDGAALDASQVTPPVPYAPPRGRPVPDDGEPQRPDDEPDDVDPWAEPEIPADMPRFPLGSGGRKMPSSEAAAKLRGKLFELGNARVEYVSPQDFADVLAETGYSASWLHKQFNVLVSEGVLERTERGVYRLRTAQPAPVPA